MPLKRRIALLFHEADTPESLDDYAVTGLAEVWREEGHEVSVLFGPGGRPEADLVFVHVDLSVVPDAYLDFAARFPVAVNGRVRDIRKSAFSPHLLGADDAWDGPVIVKSDRNFGGLPEARRGILRQDGRGLAPPIANPLDYPVYGSLREVPREVVECQDLVVQKFLPEMEDGLFFIRTYQFLGDRSTCIRIGARHPIVKNETKVFRTAARPHPDVLALRARLGFDYGKFDYVERDGGALVLDLNKTTGSARNLTPEMREARRIRAGGLHSFFQEAAPGP